MCPILKGSEMLTCKIAVKHRPMGILPNSNSPWLAQVCNGKRSGNEDQDWAGFAFTLVSFILFIQPMPHTVYVGTQKSSTKRRTPLAAHRFVRVAVMMEMRKLNRMPNVLENLVVPSLRPNRHLRPTKRSKTSVLEKNDHCMSRTCSAGSWGYCAPMGSCDIYPTHQITPPNLFYICGTTIKKILF